MKTLLLCDIPPCRNWTAGLVLDQLCRLLPPGSVACFSVLSPGVDARVSPDLDGVAATVVRGPRQVMPSRRSPRLQQALSMAINLHAERRAVPRLVRQAVAFGREVRADRLWVTLQGPTLIRMAVPVADQLNVPMATQVFDPPHWWLREGQHDRFSAARVLRCFEEALRRSTCCAAASWAMAEQYRSDYGVPMVPLIPSLDEAIAFPPAQAMTSGDRFVLGLAGQIYATAEWQALLQALDRASWKIGGKEVVIRILGRHVSLGAETARRVEFLGWRSQAETVRLLAEADVLYCPYWFNPVFEREARLSFPSKLTTYLAAGRPVLFHGPAYASPARFLEEHQAGICCHSLDPHAVVEVLEDVVRAPDTYRRLAGNASRTFRQHLSLTRYRAAFREFLTTADELVPDIAQPRSAAA